MPLDDALAPPQETCRAFASHKLDAIERALRDRYKPRFSPSRVIVDFACDPVEEVTDIVIEVAAELPRQLTLLSFQHRARYGDYDVFGIDTLAPEELPAVYDYRSVDRFTVKLAKLEVRDSALDVEAVRAALAATLNEVPLSDGFASVQGFGGGPGLRRLVRFEGVNTWFDPDPETMQQQVRFADSRKERRYTGRFESSRQAEYLPLELASRPLLEAVPAAAYTATLAPDHKRLLVAQFSASFDQAPSWLRELLLALAIHVGSIDLVPALVQTARGGSPNERVLAVSALAAITGWDVRFDSRGKPRPISDVAIDYERECASAADAAGDLRRARQLLAARDL